MKRYLLIGAFCSLGLVDLGSPAVGQLTSSAKGEKSGELAGVDFWDPIPPTPSTTLPEGIQDGYWREQFERVNREVLAAEGTRIVFFGDSLTLNWSAESGTGKGVWNEYFAKYRPINMGNSGDITPVMLYRVRNGNLAFPEDQDPKIAVLLCGTNNFAVTQSAGGSVKWDLGEACPPEDVAHGIRAIAQEFRNRLPQTRLIIMGILPVANDVKRAKCRQVNDHLQRIRLDNDDVVFVDLWDKFMNPDGSLNRELFTDGTHLTEAGYRVWAASIEPLINNMVDEKPADR